MVNREDAFGVATLIRNEDDSQNKFRMIGSIAFGNNFIEIVPIITQEQQSRNKRSNENGEVIAEPLEYDAGQNSHLVELNDYPKFDWTDPVQNGKCSNSCEPSNDKY